MAIDLLMKHEWLLARSHAESEDAIYELVTMCDTNEKFSLMDELLSRFCYMDDEFYQRMICKIADHIIRMRYNPLTTVVIAAANDEKSDGSQDVLYILQTTLEAKQYSGFRTRSMMPGQRSLRKMYNEGIRNFVVVDDFLGTGQTAESRYRRLVGDLGQTDVHISMCQVSGMKFGVDYCHRKGIPLYCPNQLLKGLSSLYHGFELSQKFFVMRLLEMHLAPQIGRLLLSNHTMGYGRSEALFYREGRNIPNNVFPIFWWKAYSDGRMRIPLFTRRQNGY